MVAISCLSPCQERAQEAIVDHGRQGPRGGVHEMEGTIFGSRSSCARYKRCKLCRFVVQCRPAGDMTIKAVPRLGFYYVCVDFNPPPVAVHPAATEEMEVDLPEATVPSKMESLTPPRRDSSIRPGRPSPSLGVRGSTPVATMNGFYFHQNSEPWVASPSFYLWR